MEAVPVGGPALTHGHIKHCSAHDKLIKIYFSVKFVEEESLSEVNHEIQWTYPESHSTKTFTGEQ